VIETAQQVEWEQVRQPRHRLHCAMTASGRMGALQQKRPSYGPVSFNGAWFTADDALLHAHTVNVVRGLRQKRQRWLA
jgi:hypothetical protein